MSGDSPVLLRIRGLSKTYVSATWLSRQEPVAAISEVDLEVGAGRTLAIVGESGSGKSTLARCVAGLEQPGSGSIWFDGTEISGLSEAVLRPHRSQIQLVLQHSAGALNPRFTALQAIEEPLLLQRGGTAVERKSMVARAMEQVGLSAEWGARRVLQFSGGQRQRLSLARALVLQPKLLILDEALSGLDLSIQAQILNLLMDLQKQHALTYIFIAHDLELVSQVADDVVVMYRGRVVESGAAAEVMRSPQHEYTKALLRAQSLLSAAASA